MRTSGERGQAAVESAITLPLMIFLILGTIQLFLMLQARILAEYAAFRAVRVGSVHEGSCGAMTDAALLALLPSYHPFLNPGTPGSTPAVKMANAFQSHQANRYLASDWSGLTPNPVSRPGAIVWILRERPVPSAIPGPEDRSFDSPSSLAQLNTLRRLEIRLVYWYPMRIPFANWVFLRMILAQYGMVGFSGVMNPLMPTQTADWAPTRTAPFNAAVRSTLLRRYGNGEMVFPIQASATFRMMTPARRKNWVIGGMLRHNCPPAPEFSP